MASNSSFAFLLGSSPPSLSMSMFAIAPQAVLLFALSWGLLKGFRHFFVRTALDNIPGPPAKSFWKGVFPQVFDGNGWAFHKDMIAKYGSVIKIKGLLGSNLLFIFDPKALHQITVKDQYIYEETSGFINGMLLVFGPGLLGTLGEQHRKQRKMLNPVFSIKHMRDMVPTFYNIANKLQAAFAEKVKDGAQEVEVLSWLTRAALEMVAQSGLGYSFDSLKEDAVLHPYTSAARRLTTAAFKLTFVRTYFLSFFMKIGSPWFRRRFFVDAAPWKSLHEVRDIVDVMHQTSVKIIETKKKALAEGDEAVAKQIGQGKDILSILMRANMEFSGADRLTDEELYGQVSTLTFAATDTTSSALSRTLWLLAQHPDAQDKLRQELRDAGAGQTELAYDDLVGLPYLDAVCRETLRLYPPISTVLRTTRQDVVLPLGTPIRGLNGQELHEIPIPNNTNIILGLRASNCNPEIWGPDSYEWKPERWLNELPEAALNANIPGIYSHLMTFLSGGRACIGFKFSQLEMKVVLSVLTSSFKFSLPKKEVVWQMSAIVTPCVVEGGKTLHSQLPLIVELAK